MSYTCSSSPFCFFFFFSSARRRSESSSGWRISEKESDQARKKEICISVIILFLPLHTHTDLLSTLQIPITLWNMGPEKQTRSLRVSPLGKPNFRGLCWGVRQRRASAWIPYLSSVHDGLSNHCCFCSHQSAWSDQSFLISTAQHSRGH